MIVQQEWYTIVSLKLAIVSLNEVVSAKNNASKVHHPYLWLS